MQELNNLLQPLGAPVTSERGTVGYQWDTSADRGMVRSMQIQNFSFNQGTGGTLTLTQGMTIKNSAGTTIIDSTGLNSNNNFLGNSYSGIPDCNTSSSTFIDIPIPEGSAGTISFVLDRSTLAYLYLTDYSSNKSLMNDVQHLVQTTLNAFTVGVGTVEILRITTPGLLVNNGTSAIVQDFYGYNGIIASLGAGTWNLKTMYKSEFATGTSHVFSLGFGYLLFGN